MNKKAIAILGAIFLLIVGTLGFLIYQKKSGGNKDTTPSPSPTAEVTATPTPEETPPPVEETPPVVEETPPPVEETPPPQISSGAVKLTDSEVLSPVLFYQGNGVAYLNSNGQLFQSDLQVDNAGLQLSNIRELIIPEKAGLRRVLWPAAGNNFIAEFGSGGRQSWSVYVSDKGSYLDLPNQVTSINWMPSGDKILYVWLDKEGKSTLNIANSDNSGYQVITDFWENDNAISISPDGRNILFYETQVSNPVNKINLVTADGKLFRSVVKDGYNTGAIWSPDSRKFAFFKGEPGGLMEVWVGNLFTGETKSVGVYSGADKIVWSGDSQNIYVAGSAGSGSQESVYKFNLASGQSATFDLGGASVREPFLTSTGDKLLFRNEADGNRLYYVDVSGR